MTHHYADINDVSIHYASAGSGKLILFLHGFPQFWYEWKHQLVEFGTDHHAVAPDMRGYNLSSKPDSFDAYTIPIICEDIRQLIAHLRHERCVLVAHDWGGVIAWSFAGRHPELLDKLVIINCPHPALMKRELRDNPDQQKASQYFNLFRSDAGAGMLLGKDCAALSRMLLRTGKSEGYFDDADEAAYLEAWKQPGAIQAGLNYYRNLPLSPDVEEAATMSDTFDEAFPELQIGVKTLVIWGEQDSAMVVDNLTGLESYVSDLKVERLPEAGHWVPNQYPQEVNQAIRRFID
jgi:epoxide hydrolase 4